MSDTLYRHRLPHIRSQDAIYFVTWRIRSDQPELSQSERDCVVAAVRHFDRDRYVIHAYVVMNDHAHVLVEPLRQFRLQAILHSWKSFTARRLQLEHGRTGAVWQDEYFDRVIRDEAEYEQKREYILMNPFRRWPEIASYRWRWAIGIEA